MEWNQPNIIKRKNAKGHSATPTKLSYIAIFVEFLDMETVDLGHENAVKIANMILNDGATAIAAGGVKKPIQSLNQYIKKYSYNTMNVTGGVYPQNESGEVVSYVTPQSRNYYQPYRSTATDDKTITWTSSNTIVDKNGASSGTAGYSYRLEGIEVVLVPKGSNGPGSVGNAFVQR